MSFAVITCIYQSLYQVINNITQKKNAKNSNFSERKKERKWGNLNNGVTDHNNSCYMSITIFLQHVKGDNVIIDITMAKYTCLKSRASNTQFSQSKWLPVIFLSKKVPNCPFFLVMWAKIYLVEIELIAKLKGSVGREGKHSTR